MSSLPAQPKNPKIKLNNLKIANLPLPDKEQKQVFHWDSDTKGLAARLTSGGSRSWIVQKRVNGKTRRFTIGPCELIPIGEARARAMIVLLEMHDGKDPQTQKKQKQIETETLREVMESYLNRKSRNKALSRSTQKTYRDCVEKYLSDWADSPIAAINRDDCVKRFEEISKRTPPLANLVFKNLRSLLNYARERSATEDGQYTITNPVSQMLKKGGLATLNVVEPRTERVPRKKIGVVWNALNEFSCMEGNKASTYISSDLVMFLLLTGARRGEASTLTWDRVKLDADIPTFHFNVTKNHRPITLPMSSALQAVMRRRLRARRMHNNFVFPAVSGTTGYMSDARSVVRKLSTIADSHLYPHCFRRTFDDIAQLVGVDGDQRRQLLNHVANDVHGRSYANNPDPEVLFDAVEKIGAWIESEAAAVKA